MVFAEVYKMLTFLYCSFEKVIDELREGIVGEVNLSKLRRALEDFFNLNIKNCCVLESAASHDFCAHFGIILCLQEELIENVKCACIHACWLNLQVCLCDKSLLYEQNIFFCSYLAPSDNNKQNNLEMTATIFESQLATRNII
jgi:hypothetical protein